MAMPELTTPLITRIAGTEIVLGSITFTADGEAYVTTPPEQLRLARDLAKPHMPGSNST